MARKKPSKRITTKRVQETEDLPPPVIPDVEAKPEVDEDPWGDDGLTMRQRAFVEAIVGPAAGNATKAAEMAGYASENRNALAVTACQTLGKPNVQEAIAHALAKRKATPEWAQAQLVDLASASMANFVVVNDQGEAVVDMTKAATAGALGQIKEYREDVLKSGGNDVAVIRRTIKIHDRTAALGLLLKLHGKLVELHEHSGPNGGPIETTTTHKFDHDRYRELFARRRQRADVDGHGPADADRN